MTAPRGPAIERVAIVASELGELASRVVFIGGAIAPLLQSDPPFPRARPTSDVDAVIATTSYMDSQRVDGALAQQGFRHDPVSSHAHRWIAPSGIPFDLVPAGSHLGGSGHPWDTVAIATAIEVTLSGGLTIRHASAPAFLAQKWAAYSDRGRDDPLASRDLEDILALMASRPTIVADVGVAPAELRAYLAEQARSFMEHRDAEDLLSAHLNSSQDATVSIEVVRIRLRGLAGSV